jgi:hypothetical protein
VTFDSPYAVPSAVRSYQRNFFHILRMVFHALVQIILSLSLLVLQVVANPEDIKTIKLVYIYNVDQEWDKGIKLVAFT